MTLLHNYTEENIKSLDWKEHIRLRPGMYIGKLGDGSRTACAVTLQKVKLRQQLSCCLQDHRPPLWLLEFVDLLFEFLNERIELGNVGRVVSLLVLSKAKQICNVLWSPAVEVQFILLQQQLPQRFILRASLSGE